MIEEYTVEEKLRYSVEPSDWRYSAAALGLMRYFEHIGQEMTHVEAALLEERERTPAPPVRIIDDVETGGEYLDFDASLITEREYLRFCEAYYGKDFSHLALMDELKYKKEYPDDEIKAINHQLTVNANVPMKKVIGKTRFDGSNREEITALLSENQDFLTKETFRNKKNMYANYANGNCLMREAGLFCRLNGYYIDEGKKGLSKGYGFEKKTIDGGDHPLLDFVPFAFTGDFEFFFINASVSLEELKRVNDEFAAWVKGRKDSAQKEHRNVRYMLFAAMIASADFMRDDVEVIHKGRDAGYFDTLYFRSKAIQIIKGMSPELYRSLCISPRISNDNYLNVQNEVMEHILNDVVLDDLIEMFIKNGNIGGKNDDGRDYDNGYMASRLIAVDCQIRNGGIDMGQEESKGKKGFDKKGMNVAMGCAFSAAQVLMDRKQENKISSYRTKLTSCVVFKDYDRFCQILLQLSNYTDVPFSFAYDLFEDFETNKDVAYTFVNALRVQKPKDDASKEK